jgi:amino acid transporter
MAEKSPVDSVSSNHISDDKSPNAETITDGDDVADGIIIENGLRRGLLGRHVTLISLASVIGASCFYGFGYALYLSGPLGALIGFSVIGKSCSSWFVIEQMLIRIWDD